MTGPFVSVQESKRFGPTWVNVARIVKIQASSNGTTIFLEGAGAMQVEEPAEVLVGRLEEVLAGLVIASTTPGRPLNGVRRGRVKPAEEQHG
jgi:hypothetical protein